MPEVEIQLIDKSIDSLDMFCVLKNNQVNKGFQRERKSVVPRQNAVLHKKVSCSATVYASNIMPILPTGPARTKLRALSLPAWLCSRRLKESLARLVKL